MTITDREAMVLIACDNLGGRWHQHYLRKVAEGMGSTMTECEFAARFDALADKGCVAHVGSLLYDVTPLGKRFAQAWRKRNA